MITMFLMGLVGAAVILGVLPFLAFSLMLETCAKRRGGEADCKSTSTLSDWSRGDAGFPALASNVVA
jgi:hypothetical protein